MGSSNIKYMTKEIADKLVGAKITGALESPGNDHSEGSFGFAVKTKTDEKLQVWVDMDPEGNGPGWLSICQESA
jgi:hypothetical protein